MPPNGEFGDDFFSAALDMARAPLTMFMEREIQPSGGSFLPSQSAPTTDFESAQAPVTSGSDFFQPLTGALGSTIDMMRPESLPLIGSFFSPGEGPPDLYSMSAANKQSVQDINKAQKTKAAAAVSSQYPRQAGTVGPGAEPPNTSSPWWNVAVNTAIAAGMSPQDAEIFGRAMSWESGGFSEDVIHGRRNSTAGAEGIAQIVRRYHPGVNPLDPNAALQYAANLFKGYLQKYGSWTNALIAYNAGEGTVGSEYIPGETRIYLQKILGDQSQVQRPTSSVAGGAGADPGIVGTTGQGQKYQISFDYGAKYDTPIISDITGQPVTHHRGVDLILPGPNNGRGSAIQPFVPGVVVNVGHAAAAGNYVVIQDGAGQFHWYMHLDSALVGNGQRVDAMTTIGTLGGTATEGFPHLHYEVRTGSQNGQAVDPRPYMR